jgi:hypothetical protein
VEVVVTATYLKNKSPNSCLEGVTLLEAWSGEKPVVNHLKVFSSIAFVRKPKEMDRKTTQGLFVGFGGKSYRAWISAQRKPYISKDILVVENPLTPMISMGDNAKPDNQIVRNQHISRDLKSEAITEEDTIHDSEFPKTPQRPKRERKFPNRLKDFVAIAKHANIARFLEDPTTLAKALA